MPMVIFLSLPKPELACSLPLIAMLMKEPEMPQTDAFCGHTMQQNATMAGDLAQTPLVEHTVLHQIL